MDIKLPELEKGTAGNEDAVMIAYASIASRQKRREAFMRSAVICCVCTVLFSVIGCFIAVHIMRSGGSLPDILLLFDDPGDVRTLLKRFFILACVPVICFTSAHSAIYGLICPLCCCGAGALCGMTVLRSVTYISASPEARIIFENVLPISLSLALCTVYTIFASVCLSYGSCRMRGGVTEEDRGVLIDYGMITLSVILTLVFAQLLIFDLLLLFT